MSKIQLGDLVRLVSTGALGLCYGISENTDGSNRKIQVLFVKSAIQFDEHQLVAVDGPKGIEREQGNLRESLKRLHEYSTPEIGDLVRHIGTGELGICTEVSEVRPIYGHNRVSVRVEFSESIAWFGDKQLDVIRGPEADSLKIRYGLDKICVIKTPNVDPPKRCGSCAFYQYKTNQMGRCVALPPTSGWPVVCEDSWCGHWKSNVK